METTRSDAVYSTGERSTPLGFEMVFIRVYGTQNSVELFVWIVYIHIRSCKWIPTTQVWKGQTLQLLQFPPKLVTKWRKWPNEKWRPNEYHTNYVYTEFRDPGIPNNSATHVGAVVVRWASEASYTASEGTEKPRINVNEGGTVHTATTKF